MSDNGILDFLISNREKAQLYVHKVHGNTIIIKSKTNPDFMLRVNINKNDYSMKEKILKIFEEVWVAVDSTNPDIPVGTTIIPMKKDSKLQHFMNMDTFRETYVKWEFLCYRGDLDDPQKKAEIVEKVNRIKEQVNKGDDK